MTRTQVFVRNTAFRLVLLKNSSSYLRLRANIAFFHAQDAAGSWRANSNQKIRKQQCVRRARSSLNSIFGEKLFRPPSTIFAPRIQPILSFPSWKKRSIGDPQMTRFKMSTAWGKRKGWEIQKLTIERRVFYRMTGKTWCLPATPTEIALWRRAKLPFGKESDDLYNEHFQPAVVPSWQPRKGRR